MAVQQLIDEEQILQGYIEQLLGKEEDRQLDIELHGYPADWLDDPRAKLIPKIPVILEGSRCSFELLRTQGDSIIVRNYHKCRAFLLDFKTKRVYINCKKLQLLFDHYGGGSYIRTNRGTDIFFVPVPLKEILRYADKID